jgi:hypothetical protein
MTMQTQGRCAGEPARLLNRMTYADEFIFLMDHRKRIDQRLDVLAEYLNRALRSPGLTLPKSGLRLAGTHPGRALFKGGRNV